MTSVLAVDVGGTFTDVVALKEGEVRGRKVPTSADQSEAVIAASLGGGHSTFLHGTTSATNTLLEGRGGRVALVTSPGYLDLIEIGRQDRPSLYDSSADRPEPLVERDARFTTEGDRTALAGRVAACAPEIVAVGLIESHIDPSDERSIAAELRELLQLPVVAASEVSPEFREYERLATTALSAYLTPSVSLYLRSLDRALAIRTRLVMTSSGGLIPFEIGSELAGRLVLSGPAAGAVAAAALGHHHGFDEVLSFDMGGTSTDVSRISRGELAVVQGHTVAGRVNRVPSVPIRTIGAGGGSVGWVDPGGALRVGPRSAGAVPGPAAYGMGGGEPTVTDAHLVSGNIPDWLALGGSVSLNGPAADAAMTQLGERLGLDEVTTAAGILEVADSHMEHALRSVSVEEGADPRESVLVAFGGAGGLHASGLAHRLGIETVMIPPLSGVFSALGLLLAVPRADVARTVMLGEGDDRYFDLSRSLQEEVAITYRSTFSGSPDGVTVSCDVRYVGQSHELEVDAEGTWGELRARFEQSHRTRFGFQRAGEPIEVVNMRAAATGRPPFSWDDLPSLGEDAKPSSRNGVWDRDTLPAGFELAGPFLVVDANSATLVGESDTLVVLEDGTLEITCG